MTETIPPTSASIKVTWSKPSKPNGKITYYKVVFFTFIWLGGCFVCLSAVNLLFCLASCLFSLLALYQSVNQVTCHSVCLLFSQFQMV